MAVAIRKLDALAGLKKSKLTGWRCSLGPVNGLVFAASAAFLSKPRSTGRYATQTERNVPRKKMDYELVLPDS